MGHGRNLCCLVPPPVRNPFQPSDPVDFRGQEAMKSWNAFSQHTCISLSDFILFLKAWSFFDRFLSAILFCPNALWVELLSFWRTESLQHRGQLSALSLHQLLEYFYWPFSEHLWKRSSRWVQTHSVPETVGF